MARRAAVLFFLAISMPIRASAADSPEVLAARAAYDRGTVAFEAKDWPAAARAFAEADAIVPNDVALGVGIDAATRADDPVLAIELAERTDARKTITPELAKAAHDARARFAGRVGKVRVRCSGCTATIDGKDVPIETPRLVTTGKHSVVMLSGKLATTREIDVAAGAIVVVTEDHATPPPPVTTEAKGISPVWFFVGAGATAVLGGFTIASALVTKNDHSTFESRGCAVIASTGCSDLADQGASSQRRTNILAAATGVALVATTVTLFFVRWSRVESSAAVGPGFAVASLRVGF